MSLRLSSLPVNRRSGLVGWRASSLIPQKRAQYGIHWADILLCIPSASGGFANIVRLTPPTTCRPMQFSPTNPMPNSTLQTASPSMPSRLSPWKTSHLRWDYLILSESKSFADFKSTLPIHTGRPSWSTRSWASRQRIRQWSREGCVMIALRECWIHKLTLLHNRQRKHAWKSRSSRHYRLPWSSRLGILVLHTGWLSILDNVDSLVSQCSL